MKGFIILPLLTLLAIPSPAAERTIPVKGRYLNIPVSHSAPRVRLMMEADGMDPMPFVVRLTDGKPDYWVFKDLSRLKGKKLTVSGDISEAALGAAYVADTIVGASSLYAEALRPQYHFTTARGWINDPNGLIWHDGEYHLFYQHNPYEREWENMHWGHAVSPDLLHWEELDDALFPDKTGTMFSGSAIIDTDNLAGFNRKGRPAMLAYYTCETGERQIQCMAYSLDNGRTFTKYKANPLIDSKEEWNSRDTRDPKVFRYSDGRYVMVLNERDGHSIFNSSDLRTWERKSHVTGFWECPELFELPVDGDPSNTLWVMYGASGTYMLGHFDGAVFSPVSGKHRYSAGSVYAAQTFNNIPASDGRRIQIGWSRIDHPGMPFHGQMLLPTELSLRTTKDGVRLVSVPVREVESLCTPLGSWQNLSQDEALRTLRQFDNPDGLRIRTTIALSHATDAVISLGGARLVDYDMNGNMLNGMPYSPDDPTSMELTVDIFVDRASAEVFVEGGLFSYSFGRERRPGQDSFYIRGNRLTFKNLEISRVEPVWNRI